MILFSQRRMLGELYKQWIIDNHVLDCPSSVVDFLQVKGLLNEEKTHIFLAVKTDTVIDGTGSTKSNNHYKEETIMANKENDAKDLQQVKPGEVPAKPDKPNKEFFLKRWAKGAWDGICKLGKAVKESPVTHFVMAGAGVAGTLVVEEVIRRKVNGATEECEPDEPIEIEDTGEVDISELPEVDETDEVTEE